MEEEEEGKGKHKNIETEVQSAEQTVATATEDAAGGSTGRSYECIFCKRGFSTAQALGGHMNIHRKDRDRSRVATKSSSITTASASASASASEVNYHGYYHPYSTHHKRSNSTSSSFTSPLGAYINHHPPDHQSSSRCVTMNDGVTSVDEDDHRSTNTTGRRRPRELRLFGEELNLGLGLSAAAADDDDRRHIRDGEENREDAEELDLELRLGHEPNK